MTTRAEAREIIRRAKEIRELLAEFGARLVGFDPGVTANVVDLPGGHHPGFGGGYWGEHMSFNSTEWAWLKPLLEELRDRRRKEKDGARAVSKNLHHTGRRKKNRRQ